MLLRGSESGEVWVAIGWVDDVQLVFGRGRGARRGVQEVFDPLLALGQLVHAPWKLPFNRIK